MSCPPAGSEPSSTVPVTTPASPGPTVPITPRPAGAPPPRPAGPAFGWPAAVVSVAGAAGLGLLMLLASARFAHARAPSGAWWTAWTTGCLMLLPQLLASGLARAPRPGDDATAPRWRRRESSLALVLALLSAAYAAVVWQAHRPLQIVLGGLLVACGLLMLSAQARRLAASHAVPRWQSWHPRVAFPLLGMMSGALLLSALVPVAAAPVAARIGVVLLILGAVLEFAWWLKFADRGAAPADRAARARANARMAARVGVFVLAFAAPFVIMGISTTFAPVAAGLCLAGLVIERRLYFTDTD